MKYLIEKDKSKRQAFHRHERKRTLLRALVRNENLSRRTRWKISLQLHKFPRDGSPTRIRNRCVLTGRPRGIQSNFKVSRITLRDLISQGNIPGVVKYNR